MQNDNSFTGDSYGGMQLIIIDQANRLLHVNLTSFISHVMSPTMASFSRSQG